MSASATIDINLHRKQGMAFNSRATEILYGGAAGGLGKLEAFMDAIETVTPVSKKLTCRNQFNNSSSFTWDMVPMTVVAPKVWGAEWQDDIGLAWVAGSTNGQT